MSEIVLEQVTKTYPNGFTAVQAVDLTIPDGQFMVLVGPSGCGKTTLLRMIAGLERITAGTVRIGDRVVNDLGPRERDIAMVFQNYALYPHMTVAQNAGFALKLAKLPKAQIATRVRDAAEVLGLGPWLERKPGELSGGQRQRVAMGRAIVREPSAFLMDEPLSNLDAKLRVQMRAEISRIQRRLDVATVYVTHDQVEAMTMGDRVAVMRDGVVLQVDEPQMVYEHPVDMFVGSFIGSPAMNLYEAWVEEGGAALRVGSQHVSLAALHPGGRSALAARAGQKVLTGLRPEHLTPAGETDNRAILAGDVELVEALGSELLVHFTLDANRVRAEGDADEVEEQLVGSGIGVARVDPRTQVRPGERVRFTVDVARMHFFDPGSGRSLLNGSQDRGMALAAASTATSAGGHGGE